MGTWSIVGITVAVCVVVFLFILFKLAKCILGCAGSCFDDDMY